MNELQITEYKNIRVLTTQQIAEAYGSDTRVISNNFNRNKDRYVEGKHYICLEGDELKDFKTNHQFDESSRINKLYLWTEKGAFLHAKSLNTDMAWEVYDRLVDNYFEKPKAVPMTTDQKIQLLAQGNVELTERIDKVDKDLQEFKADMPLLALVRLNTALVEILFHSFLWTNTGNIESFFQIQRDGGGHLHQTAHLAVMESRCVVKE